MRGGHEAGRERATLTNPCLGRATTAWGWQSQWCLSRGDSPEPVQRETAPGAKSVRWAAVGFLPSYHTRASGTGHSNRHAENSGWVFDVLGGCLNERGVVAEHSEACVAPAAEHAA